jgi:hypothetical protein
MVGTQRTLLGEIEERGKKKKEIQSFLFCYVAVNGGCNVKKSNS